MNSRAPKAAYYYSYVPVTSPLMLTSSDSNALIPTNAKRAMTDKGNTSQRNDNPLPL